MSLADITDEQIETLKADGYSEADLSMLGKSELDALLSTDEVDETPAAKTVNTVDATDADDEAAAAAATSAAATGTQAEGEVAAEEETTAEDATFVPQYRAEVPADAADQIKALKAEERGAFKQLMDGVIDADQYQEIRDRTEAQADELKTKALTASIFQQANAQASEQALRAEWNRAERAAYANFKAEGLDYASKPALHAAFHTNLGALASDPKNENKDAAWFLAEAHRLTKADIGFMGKTPTPAVPGAKTPVKPAITKRVDPAEIPPTLRSVPASASSAVQSDEFSHLRSLMDSDPLGFERAVAKLTPDQRDRWMSE